MTTTISRGYDRKDFDDCTNAARDIITLKDLLPETTYYVALVSGQTVDDGDGGPVLWPGTGLYRVTTGPALSIPAAHSVYGRVLQPDGVTPAAGALVYLTLHDSDGGDSPGQAATLSALTDAEGYWAINLGSVRTQDGGAYFAYADGDRMSLEAWHTLIARASQATAVGEAAPSPSVILDGGLKSEVGRNSG